MSMNNIINKAMGHEERPKQRPPSSAPHNTFLQDIYFTSKFRTKANEWGLTEDHARHVYYEGEPVKGKENMKA